MTRVYGSCNEPVRWGYTNFANDWRPHMVPLVNTGTVVNLAMFLSRPHMLEDLRSQ